MGGRGSGRLPSARRDPGGRFATERPGALPEAERLREELLEAVRDLGTHEARERAAGLLAAATLAGGVDARTADSLARVLEAARREASGTGDARIAELERRCDERDRELAEYRSRRGPVVVPVDSRPRDPSAVPPAKLRFPDLADPPKKN